MGGVAAIVLTAYLASARSDTAAGFELPVITAVVLGGVDIFGGSGTLGGVVIALFVLAFCPELARSGRSDPEEQQIATGAVLIGTLLLFGAVRFLRAETAARRLRSLRRAAPPGCRPVARPQSERIE